MMTATPENVNAPSDDGKIRKLPWHESAPDKGKSIEDAWKEQFALISALSVTSPSEESDEEGKRAANLDNKELIQKVQDMRKDGSLENALTHLAAGAKAPPKPKNIVHVAQLLCIMDECVYMRDFEAEKKVHEEMKVHAEGIADAMDKSKNLDGSTLGAIKEAPNQMDQVINKIKEVAEKMGLKYVPLCNFSSYGKILCNGPYCGAFYREPQNGDNGLIVVAFKGTGTFAEWTTNATFKLVPAKDKSSLRGKCHKGFFDGMFSELPSEVSADQTIGKAIPFKLLKHQLCRLDEKIAKGKGQVPVWITGHSLGGAYATHCWQGLLATSRVNPHDMHRTICDLFTFGSPRVGDQEYARYPNAIKTSQHSWRFVNGNDIVTKLPLNISSTEGYRHLDRKVKISSEKKKIVFRKNKLDTSKEYEVDDQPEGAVGHVLGFPAHTLASYWDSLRNGKVGKLPPIEEDTPILPDRDSLVSWTLEDYHPQEPVDSESHKDHGVVVTQESVSGVDNRRLADISDYNNSGKYRSVVKIQSMFSAKNSSEPIWTMGTGWLIREDLVVTAGHNVYSKTYGGQAKRIKCWIGYRGRNAAKHSSVQHRNALNIVTTASWYNQDGKRQRDVALIQVSAPFEGDLNLFQFRPTDTVVNEKPLTIVGYPGDKYVEDNGNRDYGANMYSGKSNITFNLEETGGMIEYRIDTFGGQSGAPILLGTEEGLIGIGTHCYGAGGDHPLNSGNAIGGLYGNNYEKFRGCLDGVNPRHPTAIGTFRPRFESVVNISAPGDVEESFWDVFKTVAKIGSVVVPSAGAFMGPAGILLGTVTGGILGSLAECASFHESAPNTPLTTPDKDVQDRCIERAQLAEAALQSVIRLGRSLQSDEVFKEMERIWRQSYFQQIPELVNLISPVLTEYGFLIAADHWEKKVEPNPEERESFEGKVSLKPPEDFENSPNAAFVRALYKNETKRIKGIPEGGEESLSQWLTPLIKRAIIIAKPFATKVARKALKKLFEKITKGSAESFPTGNKQKPLVKNIVCRAIIADCALQAIEKLTEEQLQDLTLSPTDAGNEEGIIDSIKTRIQKIGPVALRYAKTTIRQYLPVLLEQLNTRLDPDTKSQKLKTLSTSDFHSNDLVSPFYEEDGNPDAPPVEPRPPASPIIE